MSEKWKLNECLQSTRGNKAKAMVNEINGVMTGERRKNKKKNREKNREDRAGVRNNIPGLDPQKIWFLACFEISRS